MLLNYTLVTGPTAEPVALAMARNQCRVDFDDDDDYLTMLIVAAREYCEIYTQRAIFSQTWQRTLDNFPIWWNANGTVNPVDAASWPYFSDIWGKLTIDLPMAKATSITSITYTDISGTSKTLDPTMYKADFTSTPCRIVPAAGNSWPEALTYLPGSVVITYVAGCYGDGTDLTKCPRRIVQAILLLVGHWYINRSDVSAEKLTNIPTGVKTILDQFKVTAFTYRP
jgi:uncharacterized phiE125 gp8 family phage protein